MTPRLSGPPKHLFLGFYEGKSVRELELSHAFVRHGGVTAPSLRLPALLLSSADNLTVTPSCPRIHCAANHQCMCPRIRPTICRSQTRAQVGFAANERECPPREPSKRSVASAACVGSAQNDPTFASAIVLYHRHQVYLSFGFRALQAVRGGADQCGSPSAGHLQAGTAETV
jgi:hypothetical protein